MLCVSVCHAAVGLLSPLPGTRGVTSDIDYPDGFRKTVISWPKSTESISLSWCTALFYTLGTFLNI
jgi:hypothetical protein